MNERKAPRRRKKRRRGRGLQSLLLCTVFLAVFFITWHILPENPQDSSAHPTGAAAIEDARFRKLWKSYARDHHLTAADWPADLLAMGGRNPEMDDFILEYPEKHDLHPEIDLTAEAADDAVPLLMQWDERWGYETYAGSPIGVSGCGPTCLSMAALYLLDDPKYSPAYVAAFSEKKGYSVDGSGSSWTLISEGGKQLGLDVVEIPLSRDRIVRNLEVGNPVICVMGPGDFTSTGHFIVLTGVEHEQFTVNDPNSRERSERLWAYDEIKDQIRNLWVLRT